jgi:hypothetical protein
MMATITAFFAETTIPLWLALLGAYIVNLLTQPTIDLFGRAYQRITRIQWTQSYAGTYECQYHIPWYPEGQDIIYEQIRLSKKAFSGNRYVGHVIKHNDHKYRFFKYPEVRVECDVFGNYMVGWWKHPGDPKNRQHGCFMLHMDDAGLVHTGLWSGPAKTYKQRTMSGRWTWQRSASADVGRVAFGLMMLRGQK